MNVSGRIYTVSPEGAEHLTHYLKQTKVLFEHVSDGEEIVRDIELRIAEHLDACKKNTAGIATSEIDRILTLMGKPESMTEEAEHKNTSFYPKNKRLTRGTSPVLAGVCSGIAEYFSIDATIVRLITVLLVLIGAPFIITAYIVFWIFLPQGASNNVIFSAKGNIKTLFLALVIFIASIIGGGFIVMNIFSVVRTDIHPKFMGPEWKQVTLSAPAMSLWMPRSATQEKENTFSFVEETNGFPTTLTITTSPLTDTAFDATGCFITGTGADTETDIHAIQQEFCKRSITTWTNDSWKHIDHLSTVHNDKIIDLVFETTLPYDKTIFELCTKDATQTRCNDIAQKSAALAGNRFDILASIQTQ